MFIKAKWKVWLGMLAIAALLQFSKVFIVNFITGLFNEPAYTECRIEFRDEDAKYKNTVSGKNIVIDSSTAYKLTTTSEDPDIIITKDNETIDGYTKKENYAYVPLIMVANPSVSGKDAFFNAIKNRQCEKDIRIILKAIEEGKSWKDIGITSNSVVNNSKDKVTLIIPNEYDKSYQKIKNYILLALNDYKEPSEAELVDLTNRTNAILYKCTKVDSISALFHQNTWFKGIILCEENIIAKESSSFRNTCTVISPGKTMRTQYNVYIKTSKAEELEDLLTSYKFLNVTGYRIGNVDVSDSKYYKYSFQVFDFVDIPIEYPENLNELTETEPIVSQISTEISEETITETEAVADTETEANETAAETATETEIETNTLEQPEENNENTETISNSETDDSEIDMIKIILDALFVILFVVLISLALAVATM